jgi:hypothetical protein
MRHFPFNPGHDHSERSEESLLRFAAGKEEFIAPTGMTNSVILLQSDRSQRKHA